MKNIIRISLLALFLFALSFAAFGQKPTRVIFAKGATSATASGYMRGYNQTRVFVIKVRRGQSLKVDQVNRDRGPVSLSVSDPSGEDVSDMDASCHTRQHVERTVSGDYKIYAAECMKADAWRGKFTLKFTVR